MTKLKEDFEASGGVWKEWRIDDIFLVKTPKKKFNANAVTFGNNHPYVVRTSQNNGVRAYLDEDEKYLNDAKTISFGQDTATMFYQEKPYFTGDKIKIMKFKNGELTSLTACYLLASMYKSFSLFSWGTTSFNEDVLNGELVNLPTFNNEPSYSYMEQYISLLEEEKMLQVDKFLIDSGLNDTTLTAEETAALEKFSNGEVKFEERKIGELFEIKKGKRLTKANMKPGMTNFLGAISNNNGIREQIEAPFTWKPNCISVNYNGSVGYSFYQEYEFYASDDVNLCYAKEWSLDKYIALYFCTVFFKYSDVFNFGFKWSKDKMEESLVKVPVTSDNIPDFRFMQHFISAQEKLIIKGVVKYKDEVLRAHPDYSFDSHDGCSLAAETMSPLE